MSYTKIPKSVKEIVDVFIQYKFRSLTYKQISQVLDKEINAIIQRIKRNEKGYFEITNKRPYQISLRKDVKEIYFQRDRNQCQICNKTFNQEKLVLRFKNPHLKNKYNWNNVFTCCLECKNKSIAKTPRAKTQKSNLQKQDEWEYKEINIKKVIQNPLKQYFLDVVPNINFSDIGIGPFIQKQEKKELEEDYYEFDELNDKGWFHLIGNDEKISSFSLTKILNYFGNDGWDVVSIIDVKPSIQTILQFQALNQEEYYRCILKRKKK